MRTRAEVDAEIREEDRAIREIERGPGRWPGRSNGTVKIRHHTWKSGYTNSELTVPRSIADGVKGSWFQAELVPEGILFRYLEQA